MDRAQLKKILDEERVPRDAYDLNGGRDTEELVLSHTPGADWPWAVYYSERGLQTGRREFATEGEACVFMLSELRGWRF